MTRLVVVGASAGGVEALKEVVSGSAPASTDRVLPLHEIAAAVVELLSSLAPQELVSENEGDDMTLETRYAARDRGALSGPDPPGTTSRLSCPAVLEGEGGSVEEQAEPIRRVLPEGDDRGE